jgi:hypothetical protein
MSALGYGVEKRPRAAWSQVGRLSPDECWMVYVSDEVERRNAVILWQGIQLQATAMPR